MVDGVICFLGGESVSGGSPTEGHATCAWFTVKDALVEAEPAGAGVRGWLAISFDCSILVVAHSRRSMLRIAVRIRCTQACDHIVDGVFLVDV